MTTVPAAGALAVALATGVRERGGRLGRPARRKHLGHAAVGHADPAGPALPVAPRYTGRRGRKGLADARPRPLTGGPRSVLVRAPCFRAHTKL